MNPSDKFIPKIKNPKKDSRYNDWPVSMEDYKPLPKTKSKTTVDLDSWKKEEQE